VDWPLLVLRVLVVAVLLVVLMAVAAR